MSEGKSTVMWLAGLENRGSAAIVSLFSLDSVNVLVMRMRHTHLTRERERTQREKETLSSLVLRSPGTLDKPKGDDLSIRNYSQVNLR